MLTVAVTVTGPVTVLPALGTVKQSVTVYAPDEDVLDAQGLARATAVSGVLAAISGALVAVSAVLAAVSEVLAAESGVLVAVSIGVICCAKAVVNGAENSSMMTAMKNPNMCLIRIIFLPWTGAIHFLAMPVPGLLTYSNINWLVSHLPQSTTTQVIESF